MLVYAGIGSRRTPPDIYDLMVECGRLLGARDWTLRSGGADGADTAFASGALLWGPNVELYLPWRRYNDVQVARLWEPLERAYELAERYHPAWQRLGEPARALHARNSHIILGPALDDSVRMIVCWTPDGSLDGHGPDCGGTGQALRVAAGEAPDRQVFNLARPEHLDRIWRFCGRPPLQRGLFPQAQLQSGQ